MQLILTSALKMLFGLVRQMGDNIKWKLSMENQINAPTGIACIFITEQSKDLSWHTVLMFKSIWMKVSISVVTKNRMTRLNFTEEHVAWTESNYPKVNFSDESTFQHQTGENPSRNQLNIGGCCIMVWMICAAAEPLIQLHGRVYAKFLQISLHQHVIPSLQPSHNQPTNLHAWQCSLLHCKTGKSAP